MFTIHSITIQAVHQQGSWVVHSREERKSLSRHPCQHIGPPPWGKGYNREAAALRKGTPLSNFPLWGKAEAIRCRSSELSISQPLASGQSESMSSGSAEGQCSVPMSQVRAEAGVERRP